MKEKREGTESYGGNGSSAERAEWRLVTDDEDAYEKSVAGTLTVEGDMGTLSVRVRYRTDEDRLGEDVIREELGFWSGKDEPADGDVPFGTEVRSWEEKGIKNTDRNEYIRVCESLLRLDAESVYDERVNKS